MSSKAATISPLQHHAPHNTAQIPHHRPALAVHRRQQILVALPSLALMMLTNTQPAYANLQQEASSKPAAAAAAADAKLKEQQRIAEQQRKAAERAALRDRMGRFIR